MSDERNSPTTAEPLILSRMLDTGKSETARCPYCKGRGYTESLEGHHLVCTCFYEEQEAVEQADDAIGDAQHAIHQKRFSVAIACLDRAREALKRICQEQTDG